MCIRNPKVKTIQIVPMAISSSDFSPKLQTHIFTCWAATTWMSCRWFKPSIPKFDVIIIFWKSILLTIFPVLVHGTTIHQVRNQEVILALSLFLIIKHSITSLFDPVSQITLKFLIYLHHFVFAIHSSIIYKASLLISPSLSTPLAHWNFIENELFNMPILLHQSKLYNSYHSSVG